MGAPRLMFQWSGEVEMMRICLYAKEEKADKRGAFDKKIFLETVTENAR